MPMPLDLRLLLWLWFWVVPAENAPSEIPEPVLVPQQPALRSPTLGAAPGRVAVGYARQDWRVAHMIVKVSLDWQFYSHTLLTPAKT